MKYAVVVFLSSVCFFFGFKKKGREMDQLCDDILMYILSFLLVQNQLQIATVARRFLTCVQENARRCVCVFLSTSKKYNIATNRRRVIDVNNLFGWKTRVMCRRGGYKVFNTPHGPIGFPQFTCIHTEISFANQEARLQTVDFRDHHIGCMIRLLPQFASSLEVLLLYV